MSPAVKTEPGPWLCSCGKDDFRSDNGFRIHLERAKGEHFDRSSPAPEPMPTIEDEEFAKVQAPGAPPAPPEVVTADAPFTPEAIRLNDPAGFKEWKTWGMRGIWMSFPRHDECQAMDKGPGWWYRCEAKGHQPYFTPDHFGIRHIEETIGPVMKDGSQEVKVKTIRVKIPGTPNLIQVPFTGRHNGNDADNMRKQRGKGRRLPEELGLAPRCQFWGCSVKLTVATTDISAGGGGYCEENHRKPSQLDRNPSGRFPEVLNQAVREVQWAAL